MLYACVCVCTHAYIYVYTIVLSHSVVSHFAAPWTVA